MANNNKYEVYQVEVGILLEKDDPEYECYSKVWDYKHGYYNEDWGFYKKFEDARKYIDDYVKDGHKGTYGIISKIKVCKEYYEEISKGDTEGLEMDYDIGTVIFSAYKNDKDEIIEDFMDTKKNIKTNIIELEEDEVL